MNKLTVKDLYDLQSNELKERIASDYSALLPDAVKNFLSDEKQSEVKKDIVEQKYYTARFLNDEVDDISPDGNEYYDTESDSIKEYISLDRLRFKIEELGKRETQNDEFTLGKKVWEVVIKRIGLGEKIENSYIAFDDIDECYKAEHPRSKQAGFNLKCIKTFYKDNIEKILIIKKIVEDRIEKQNRRREKQRQQEAKDKREEERALSKISGGLL